MLLETIHGEESLVLGDDLSRVTVTLRGGHARIESRKFPDQPWNSPYSLPPWLPADHPTEPAMLQVLRGDFFCFPFGVSAGFPLPHGETANRTWTIESAQATSARFRMIFESMAGSVTKSITYSPSTFALLQEHVITGVNGQFNYGHHPILQIPPGTVAEYSTSPWIFGRVHPDGLAVAADGDTAGLQPGARFTDLSAVPTASGSKVSLFQHPHIFPSEDIVLLSTTSGKLSWNTLSHPGFLWLSLRLASDFPSTLLWLSNGGLSRPPWNGVHTGRIAIEDVCSYFHEGLHRSRLDLLAGEQIPTSRQFMADRPTILHHLQIAIPVETPFGQVRDISYIPGQDRLLIEGQDGKSLEWECPFRIAEASRNPAVAAASYVHSGKNIR